MDFSTIGSINAYTKGLEMQTRWNLKKQSGNVTGHTASLSDWLANKTASTQEDEEQDSKKMSAIRQKMSMGGKLTKEEKQYLKAKDPVTYQKLKAIEEEQKSYEQELKKCRTKEDVQRLKLSRVGSSLAAVKSIANNPNIPEEKKQQMIALENRRCQKLEHSTRKFVKSGEYGRLPTEAERTQAEKELREAEEARREPKAEQTEERPEAEKPVRAETEEPERAEAVKTPVRRVEARPKTAKPESQAVRKVRRAKAKAVYTAYQSLPDKVDDDTVDVKA